jgi:hypothetical protein
MKKFSSLFAALVLSLAVSTTAEAQRFGAQVSWGDESDLGIGVRGEFDFANKLTKTGAFSKAFIIGQFDYYFIDCPSGASCTFFEINPSLAVPFTLQNSNLKPYAGAGLRISRSSVSAGGFDASETDMGLNLLGGLKFGMGGLDAFTEARLGLGGDFEQLALSFGVMLGGKRTAAGSTSR